MLCLGDKLQIGARSVCLSSIDRSAGAYVHTRLGRLPAYCSGAALNLHMARNVRYVGFSTDEGKQQSQRVFNVTDEIPSRRRMEFKAGEQ